MIEVPFNKDAVYSLYLSLSSQDKQEFLECIPKQNSKFFSKVNQKDLEKLGIKCTNIHRLYGPILSVPENPIAEYVPSTHYTAAISRLNQVTRPNDEAGRREYISAAIYDIIVHLRTNYASNLVALPEYPLTFRSNTMNVTLSGSADWMIAAEGSDNDDTSILLVVEAKNDSITKGICQVVAQMMAVRQSREILGKRIDVQYGIVSDGEKWVIIQLKDHRIHRSKEYSIVDNTQHLRDWLCFLLYHIMHSSLRGSKDAISDNTRNDSWDSLVNLS